MKLIALSVVAVAALILLGAVVVDTDDITTEAVAIEVAQVPGGVETIVLDALIYRPELTPAPAIVLAHGFGSSRSSLDGAARYFASEGFVVLAYSARGFGRSQGTIGLNDPRREVADVTSILDLLAERDDVEQDGPGDPRVGVGGGSYGGGLALLAASQEPRLDAVVAAAAWHDLPRSLSPDRAGLGTGVLKEQWASVLFTSAAVGGLDGVLSGSGAVGDDEVDPDQIDNAPVSAGVDLAAMAGLDLSDFDLSEIDLSEIDLATIAESGVDSPSVGSVEAFSSVACGRFSLEICVLYAQAATAGRLSQDAVDILARSSLADRLGDIDAPTMLISGLDDTLFDLQESLDNAAAISATRTDLAVRWVPGGHAEASRIDIPDALDWFDQHLRGNSGESQEPPGDIPAFRWTDAASGAPQGAEAIWGLDVEDASFGDPLELTLSADAVLTPASEANGASADESGSFLLVHPPGGVPAALSTLPGLGNVGGLLPGVDVPGQNAAFTSAPLDADLTVLGQPILRLPVTSVGADASLFVKLYDVTPGGQTSLIHSATNPLRLDSGEQVLDIDLSPMAYRIVAGNRLRVMVATTDQGFATGRQPGVVVVQAGPNSTLTLPAAPTELTSGTPTVLRIILPVLTVLALGLAVLWLTIRHEARMAAGEAPDVDPIVIDGLVKRFDDGKVAVDGLDLTVGRGQVFGLLGPNGAGKTTTMRMLLGLSFPTEGQIRILGKPVTPGHPVLERVGVLVEGPGFAPYLTGMQNLISFWRAGSRPLAEANLDRALAVADLGTAIDKPTRTYSHGMRQRLAIAQALLGDPEILVLDEPTDGLDPEQIKAMRRLLARLGDEGLTVLVSSHLLSEVEQMCTHAAVVRAGKVVAAGPVSELVGADERLVVRSPDMLAAGRVLHDLVGEKAVEREGEGFVVSLGSLAGTAVIAALVEAGVPVSSAAPRGRLEDAFLELTKADA